MIFGKFTDLSSGFIMTVELNFNWLAKSTEQEVADSNPGMAGPALRVLK